MRMKKTTVFLTGGTGNMGWAGFQELYRRKDRFNIRLLARDSKKNHKKLDRYAGDPSVTVIWGDLTRYEDVLAGVTGSDYVLHVGGMVSPAADYYPEKTLKVNVLAAENVVKAVQAQPNMDDIKVVYIGSVAQYGDRNPPYHWGDVNEPQTPAKFDMYALSKIRSEEIFAAAGFRNWVSLRQSGILYPGILKVVNPTAFHVPVGGVLEWATIEDSGRLLAQVCEDWVPAEFWNQTYNTSSGEQYRMTNYEFETRLLRGLGLPGPEKVFEPQWFALKNFHGMWYTDADKLEDFLHFRANTPIDEYFATMKSKLPWFYSLAFLAPASIMFVGTAPRFKDSQLESRVHTVSAIIAAVCSLLWVALVTPYWWVMLIWTGFIALATILTSSYKTAYVYWLEQVAFGSTFTAAIMYSI